MPCTNVHCAHTDMFLITMSTTAYTLPAAPSQVVACCCTSSPTQAAPHKDACTPPAAYSPLNSPLLLLLQLHTARCIIWQQQQQQRQQSAEHKSSLSSSGAHKTRSGKAHKQIRIRNMLPPAVRLSMPCCIASLELRHACSIHHVAVSAAAGGCEMRLLRQFQAAGELTTYSAGCEPAASAKQQ